MANIATIVEGHSEAESIPVLLRRILTEMNIYDIQVVKPFRVKRYSIVRSKELEKAVKFVLRDRENIGCIIVILDSHDDSPEELASKLLKRASRATKLPVSIIIAVKEIESWFLGAKESLRGVRGIKDNSVSPKNPEAISGAKEHLSNNMKNRRYIEVDDQPALAEKMNFDMASEKCPSFQKFLSEVQGLISQIR